MRPEGTHGTLFVPYDKTGLPNMLQAWLNIAEHVEKGACSAFYSDNGPAHLTLLATQHDEAHWHGLHLRTGESALWLYPPFARKTLAHYFGKVTSSALCIFVRPLALLNHGKRLGLR